MNDKFIRVYKKLDVHEIKKHLMLYGDLAASCANCNAMDLKSSDSVCPQCKTEFKYISFRNVKSHYPKLSKMDAERPSLMIVDYDDYKSCLGAITAKDFLK